MLVNGDILLGQAPLLVCVHVCARWIMNVCICDPIFVFSLCESSYMKILLGDGQSVCVCEYNG